MPRFAVTCWPRSPVTVEVEADDEDEAIGRADEALSERGLEDATWEVHETEADDAA